MKDFFHGSETLLGILSSSDSRFIFKKHPIFAHKIFYMIASLLEEVCLALDKVSIPYMVSGSMAMTLYTIPRMTRDIDIIVELNKEDIDKFYNIFSDHAYIDKLTVEEEVKRRGMFNVIDHRTGYKIDFMLKKFNDYRETEFERRQFTTAFGFPMWVVSLEDLIFKNNLDTRISKRTTNGRHQEFITE